LVLPDAGQAVDHGVNIGLRETVGSALHVTDIFTSAIEAVDDDQAQSEEKSLEDPKTDRATMRVSAVLIFQRIHYDR
jgi:hypothetical protein